MAETPYRPAHPPRKLLPALVAGLAGALLSAALLRGPNPADAMPPRPSLADHETRIAALETRAYAQLESVASQSFPASTWTAVSWDPGPPIAHQISVSGADITLPDVGVYRVTLSMFNEGDFERMGVRLRRAAGGSVGHTSWSFGGLTTGEAGLSVSFLADVAVTGAHRIEIGRGPSGTGSSSTQTIAGQQLPAFQATIEKIN